MPPMIPNIFSSSSSQCHISAYTDRMFFSSSALAPLGEFTTMVSALALGKSGEKSKEEIQLSRCYEVLKKFFAIFFI